MFKSLIYRLGSHPRRSLRAFLTGLFLFLGGLGGLYINQDPESILATVAVLTVISGLACAAYGYIGIFSNRLAMFIERGDTLKRRS